jgi:transposase
VIHSSAHDKRRHKRIDRLLAQKRKKLETASKTLKAEAYFCSADAEAAAEKLYALAAGCYHQLRCEVSKIAKYPRGRPPKGKTRTPSGYEYKLTFEITEDNACVEPLRLEAGCFVLLCDLPYEQNLWTTKELLTLYKNQSGIEQNFGFLKDPVIVNSIFLKKPHRIEVLGLVLLISLLIWRLMERCMYQYIKSTDSAISGWKRRPTKRPTSFMMTTKFLHILVLKSGSERQLARPLNSVQLEFLQALNVTPDIFTVP